MKSTPFFKRSILVVFLFVLILIITKFIINNVSPSPEIRSVLDNYDISPVTENGGDEQLALYWLMAKYDPIFAIPHTDLEKLSKNLELLDVLLFSVIDTYTPEETETIKRSLYPTDFLRELTKLEQLRTDFIDSPSKENADSYHGQLLTSLDSYQEAVVKMTQTLNSLDDMTIGFLSGTTSAPVLVEKLNSQNNNVSRLINRESDRFDCLNSKFGSCKDLDISGDAKNFDQSLVFTPEDIVTEEMLGNKDAIDAFYTAKTASSTLIVIEESLCYPQEKPVVYAHWDEINDLLPNILFIRATPVNDLFLQDLNASKDHPYYKSLLDAGLTYSLQPSNLYFCIDGGMEYQKLTTIKKIYELANTISWDATSTVGLPGELAIIIDQTPKPDNVEGVLYEKAVTNYIGIIEQALNNFSEKELIGYLGQNNYESLRNIALLWQTQSVDLDKLINTAAYMTETNRGVIDIIDIPMEPLYLTRSYISLLFLLANETISETPISLLSKISPQSLESFKMISVNQVFPTVADKTKLKDMMIENRKKAP